MQQTCIELAEGLIFFRVSFCQNKQANPVTFKIKGNEQNGLHESVVFIVMTTIEQIELQAKQSY